MDLKYFLLVIYLLIQQIVIAQQPFFKAYPGNDYNSLREFVKISDNEYVFITDNSFYRVNGKGEIIVQKQIKEGMSSYLQSVLPDGTGNYWVASHVFITLNTQLKKLYKINAGGVILSSREFSDPDSFDDQRLIKAGTDGFFLLFKEGTSSGANHLTTWFFNNQGTRVWEKEMTDDVYYNYKAHVAANGSLDICYMTAADMKVWLLTVDKTGNNSKKEILHQAPANLNDITYDFCAAPGGGYVFGGDEISGQDKTNCFIYQTDRDGKMLWEKRFNVYQDDQLAGIAATADGYVLLCNAGSENPGIDELGDVTLIKTDLQGKRQWIRAFGSAKSDFARELYVDNQSIVGAQFSYPGVVSRAPTLFRTDRNGNIPGSLPFTLSPFADLKELQVGQPSDIKKLVRPAPASDGGFILGSSILNNRDEKFYPFIAKTDQQGNAVWHKDISATPGNLRVLKRAADGSYLAAVEYKDIFMNHFNLVRFAEDGTTLWTTQLSSSSIKDIISTSDGGFLVTGAMDISFVNYELVLFKLAADGSQQWQKTIGSTRIWETGRSVVETPEQDFLIVGNAQPEYDNISYLHVVKVNKNGNLLWSKTFDKQPAVNLGYNVIITADNKYVFAGTASVSPFIDKDLLLVKTDAQGNMLWEKKMNLYLLDDGFSMEAAKDGGFYIAGSTGEPEVGKLEKFSFLMKLDDKGNRTWIKYYGKEGLQTTAGGLIVTASDQPILLGTMQDAYGREHMYFTAVTPGTLEPPPAGTLLEDSINVFPNPAVGTTNLLIKNAYTGTVNIALYDGIGRRILALAKEKNSDRLLEPITLDKYPNGLYYVVIWFKGERHVRKLLLGKP